MSYELYQQTMKRLSKTLSDKFSLPIHFSDKAQAAGQAVSIPLFIERQQAGRLQVDPSVSAKHLDEIYNHVQWTLSSLEDLFQKYETPFYSGKESFPIWISALESGRALKLALDVYEKSSFQSFIHLEASVFDSSFFSSELQKTLVFISSVERLSKEDQLFLAHYLRTGQAGPSLILSSTLSVESAQKKIVPSLMECFTHHWHSFEEQLDR